MKNNSIYGLASTMSATCEASNPRRAFGAAVVIVVIGVGAAIGWCAVKLPSLFAPAKPDTVGLSIDQQKLAEAQAAAAQANAQLKAAQDAAAAARDSQLRNAQQMVVGTGLALTAASVSPPVTLAIGLNNRAQTGMSTALGQISTADTSDIQAIVAQELSGKDNQIAAAQQQLAAKDAELSTATAARSAAESKAVSLASTVQATTAAQAAAESALKAKTNEVAATANALENEQAKGSLLSNEIKSLIGWALLLAGVYFVVHYLLPILAQTFPQFGFLVGIYNTITAIFSAHQVVLPAPTPITAKPEATPPAP